MPVQGVYQFYAELEDYKPKMWRRFQTPGNITVARLAYIVMTMFEMQAGHLFAVEHESPLFTASGRQSRRTSRIGRYSVPFEGDLSPDSGDEDAAKTKLAALNLEAPSRLVLWYDFGDDWRVLLTPEAAASDPPVSARELPRVLEGAGFGIIEDCGGVWGLEDLAKAFKNKKGPDYEEYRQWLEVDDLDLAAFDREGMNRRLKKTPARYAKIYQQEL